MKTFLKILAITTSLASAALLPAHSAPTASPSPSATAAKPKLTPFHGLIAGVDSSAKSFSFSSKKGNIRTFTLSSDATILNGEAPATFADLKVGTAVRGSALKIADGKFQVSKVIIGEKEKAEASASASPAASPSASPMKKSKKAKTSPTP